MDQLHKQRLAITPLAKAYVRLSRTINTGNFENYKIEVGCDDVVSEGETSSAALTRLTLECRRALSIETKRVMAKMNKEE